MQFDRERRKVTCAARLRLERTVALMLPEVGQVTISAGVATNEDAASWDELVRAADERLYAARSAGRNRVLG